MTTTPVKSKRAGGRPRGQTVPYGAMKVCRQCKVPKPNTAEYFEAVGGVAGRGYLRHTRKACQRKMRRGEAVEPAVRDVPVGGLLASALLVRVWGWRYGKLPGVKR